MTKDEAQRRRWTFYEAVNIPFEITVCTNPAMRKEGQGHIIVKSNLLILSLLVGMGVFFLIMPLAQTWLARHE
jgi:hypothetical protein